jgi:GT2 family glycosyltransferase
MNTKKVSIIILNWNRWQYTLECVESLYQNNYSNYQVIIVDNGSQDNSIDKIIKYCNGNIIVQSKYFHFDQTNKPISFHIITKKESEESKQCKIFDKLTIIKNEINYGFSKGNNIGISYALNILQPEYILTLNNDTIVDKYFLVNLINAAEREDNIGSCQSKILFMKDPTLIDSIGISISLLGSAYQIGYQEKDYDQYNKDLEIFGVCACAALYKSRMLKDVGLFDEDFFAYYEDVDLAWRASRNQWKALYVHDSVVYHIGSATGSIIKTYYLARNRLSYLIKNAPAYLIALGLIKTISIIPLIFKVKYRIKHVRREDAIIFHYLKMFKKRKQQCL